MSQAARARTREQHLAPGTSVAGWAAFLVSAAGALVSAYLTYEHLTSSTTLACPDTGAINCAKVTTSIYSEVVGIPVAVLGVGYFLAMTVLCHPRLWRVRDHHLPPIRLALSTVGVLFVLYLIWAELFRIDAICLWCTAVHALTLTLFGIVALAEATRVTSD